MQNESFNPTYRFIFRGLLIAGLACLAISTRASTFWNGASMSYTEPSIGAADVLVAGKVGLARQASKWLYNPLATPPDSPAGANTPTDTEWAVGTTAMIGNLSASTVSGLTFIPMGGASPSVYVAAQVAFPSDFNHMQVYLLNGNGSGGPITFVVHLKNEDIYLTLTFSSWGDGGSGGFAYFRSTPSVTPPTPTVSITNPAPSAVFAAPANVNISASATVSTGSVTNVSFFNGSSLLGSSQSAPFKITANSLSAGSYSLKAVATAAGISATSSVVNISIVTPVNTSLSNPTEPNNQFVFSYNVNPGLRYVVETAPGVSSGYTPVTTNVPANSPAFFTNPISTGNAFFRVGRMPNP